MYKYSQSVIQFTKCSELMAQGRTWNSQIWARKSEHTFTPKELEPFAERASLHRSERGISTPLRSSFIAAMAGMAEDMKSMPRAERSRLNKQERAFTSTAASGIASKLPEGFSLSCGFQAYDPVIKVKNKAHTYAHLIPMLNEDAVGNARLMIQFMDDETDLEDLPEALQEFCMIVFVAEVGRGYSPDPIYAAAQHIVETDGKDDWSILSSVFPAMLTFKQDQRDYRPPDDDGPGPFGGGPGGGFGGSGPGGGFGGGSVPMDVY